jgi:hypothetical protein
MRLAFYNLFCIVDQLTWEMENNGACRLVRQRHTLSYLSHRNFLEGRRIVGTSEYSGESMSLFMSANQHVTIYAMYAGNALTTSYPNFTSILRSSVGGGDDEDDQGERDGVDDGDGSEAYANGAEGNAPAPSDDEPSRA